MASHRPSLGGSRRSGAGRAFPRRDEKRAPSLSSRRWTPAGAHIHTSTPLGQNSLSLSTPTPHSLSLPTHISAKRKHGSGGGLMALTLLLTSPRRMKSAASPPQHKEPFHNSDLRLASKGSVGTSAPARCRSRGGICIMANGSSKMGGERGAEDTKRE